MKKHKSKQKNKNKSKAKARHQFRQYTLLDEMCASPIEPLPVEWIRKELTSMWDGLAQIETGEAPDKFDWGIVADCVAFSRVFILMGETQDPHCLLEDAANLMLEAKLRFLDTGVLRLSGPGIQLIRGVLEDYAEVISVLPARRVIRCHRLTERWSIKFRKAKKEAGVELVML